MSSSLLPKTVREQLDARRRAFLWTGEEKCHGSQCLLAWDTVCQTKEHGGLGVKNLEDMNHCLLLKFVHKLHEPSSVPWKQWFFSYSNLLCSTEDTFLHRLLREELGRYRTITHVLVGNGKTTSFWHDRWMLNTTLADTFPVLFSHRTQPAISVQQAVTRPLDSQLQPRLTRSAAAERQVVIDCLANVHLTEEPDSHMLADLKRSPFTSSGAYRLLRQNGEPATDVASLWSLRLPTKVKFFGWLLHHGRLNTRDYLCRRSIRPPSESYCESCAAVVETDEHLFISCPKVSALWNRLETHPLSIDLRRNARIFDDQDSSPRDVIRRTHADIDKWSCRYRPLSAELQAWKTWVASITVTSHLCNSFTF
ncbi:putative ribonuclease H protein [Panicum miliaceum]|uniref:Ribonuclease H protein n=1 Tax=Panicum miliaceum TaxID=4540 RepID=A0A3L6RUL8_PANMI|nr:putative ribonuclease H protein [Panicum miliaceum]